MLQAIATSSPIRERSRPKGDGRGRGDRACRVSFLFSIAIAFISGTPAHAQPATKVNIGEVGTGTANHWPAYIAIEKGWFRAKGIELEYVGASSSAGVMQQLAAGSIDLGSGGLVDPIRAIDKGAAIKIGRAHV